MVPSAWLYARSAMVWGLLCNIFLICCEMHPGRTARPRTFVVLVSFMDRLSSFLAFVFSGPVGLGLGVPRTPILTRSVSSCSDAHFCLPPPPFPPVNLFGLSSAGACALPGGVVLCGVGMAFWARSDMGAGLRKSQAFHGRNRQQKDIVQFDEGIKATLHVCLHKSSSLFTKPCGTALDFRS